MENKPSFKEISVSLDQLGFGTVEIGGVNHSGDARAIEISSRVGELTTVALEFMPRKVKVNTSGGEVIFHVGSRAFRVIEEVDPAQISIDAGPPVTEKAERCAMVLADLANLLREGKVELVGVWIEPEKVNGAQSKDLAAENTQCTPEAFRTIELTGRTTYTVTVRST